MINLWQDHVSSFCPIKRIIIIISNSISRIQTPADIEGLQSVDALNTMIAYGMGEVELPAGQVRKEKRVENAMEDLFGSKHQTEGAGTGAGEEDVIRMKAFARKSKVYMAAVACILISMAISIATGIIVMMIKNNQTISEKQLKTLKMDIEEKIVEDIVRNDTLTGAMLNLGSRITAPGPVPVIAVFTRWGATSCGVNANNIFKGYTIGPTTNTTGGPVSPLCLPKIPDESPTSVMGFASLLHPLTYRPDSSESDATTVNPISEPVIRCVTCEVFGGGAVLVVPGQKTCFDGWTHQYSGYLVSLPNSSGYSAALCLDVEAYNSITDKQFAKTASGLYHVGVVGLLALDDTSLLTCVVCTK